MFALILIAAAVVLVVLVVTLTCVAVGVWRALAERRRAARTVATLKHRTLARAERVIVAADRRLTHTQARTQARQIVAQTWSLDQWQM